MMNSREFCKGKAILPFQKRMGISPILATIMLIAVTLVAAVAMAAFVFGLFGSLGDSANLTSSVAVCSVSDTAITIGATTFHTSAGGNPTCFMAVRNSGTASGTVSGCSIGGVSGAMYDATSGTLVSSYTIAGSKSVGIECDYAGGTPSVGARAGGILTTAGIGVSFAGTWLT